MMDKTQLGREVDPARGAFEPHTARGKTRMEMQNRGPMRIGKTSNDRRSGAYYRHLDNRRERMERNRA